MLTNDKNAYRENLREKKNIEVSFLDKRYFVKIILN